MSKNSNLLKRQSEGLTLWDPVGDAGNLYEYVNTYCSTETIQAYNYFYDMFINEQAERQKITEASVNSVMNLLKVVS